MAIFSLHHKTIGLSTHKVGTTSAHIRYICRASTASNVITNLLPEGTYRIASWFDRREPLLRKNARMVDKIMVALPLELNIDQRVALIEKFLSEITGNKIPWIAAFHQLGKDEANPHVHIAIHDRDLDTGKTLCGLSMQGSTQKIRELWAKLINESLKVAGYDVEVTYKSLKEQGITRKPTIHEGVIVRAMEKKGLKPHSKEFLDKKGRKIDYKSIDNGITRSEYNRGITD